MKNRKLPEGWKVEKLDTLCVDKFAGDWGSNDEEKKGVFVIRTTNFTDDGNLNFNDVVTRCIDDKVIKKKRLQFGDIILEKSGGSDNQPVGRVVYFNKTDGIYMCNNFTHVLRINKEKAVPKYVMYFLLDIHKKGITKYFQNKTTGIRNLQMKRYFKLGIELPPLEIQKKIVQALEKAEDALKKKKKAIRLLDELVKSRFIEMFGDPGTNPKNFDVVYLKEVSELITKGASPNWQGIEYVEDDTQTLFITSENVREGYLDFEKRKYLQDEFNKKQKRSVLKNGDFLINIVGASIGRVAQFNLGVKANINQAVALVRLKKGVLNDKYILTYLNSPKALQMYNLMQVSVARANLSLQNINNLEIILPPIQLQNQFADFVRQVDKLKFEMEKSLKKLEDNFNSLMQRAFNGELEFNSQFTIQDSQLKMDK